MDELLELIRQLRTIESRRHLPTAQLTHVVASGFLSSKTPLTRWLPSYARIDTGRYVPPEIQADIATGAKTRLISQEFYDALTG